MSRTNRAEAERRRLGRRIAVERLTLGLSQRDLAAHLHTRQGVISAVETGGRNYLIGTVIDIAGAVELDLALVAAHQLPLLDLTADETRALLTAAALWADNADDPDLTSAMNKLGMPADTDTEDTQRA